MSDESESPQAPSAEGSGSSRGWFKRGQSGNPGGQPKRIAKALKELSYGSVDAAKYLNRIVRGEETETVVTKDGGTVDVAVRHRDRIAASKVVLDFTVPKPKIDLEVKKTTSVLEDIDKETLIEWASQPDA